MFDRSATSVEPVTGTGAPEQWPSSTLPDRPEPGSVRGGVAVELPDLLQKLRPSSNPGRVFAQLAQLLTGSVCDEAVSQVLTGDRLARWRKQPPPTAGITAAIPAPGNGNPASGSATCAVTVHTSAPPPGNDDWTSQDDYVAALTCTWHDYRPTAADVASLKLAGRAAADLVHRSQQAELLQAQQEHLRTALISTRMIEAIGTLMQPDCGSDHDAQATLGSRVPEQRRQVG